MRRATKRPPKRAARPRKHLWLQVLRRNGALEWVCPCGVWHGEHPHGCCAKRCCQTDPGYPGKRVPGATPAPTHKLSELIE